MHMKLSKLLFLLIALIWVSCECPYPEERQRAYRQNTNTKGDVLYADMLLGTWQCYYPMIIGGVEFKQIKFMSNGKADIIMAKQHDTEWYTETFSYAYYGNTLRFSKSGINISLTIEGFLYPELYLRDSISRYTMAKRRANGC